MRSVQETTVDQSLVGQLRDMAHTALRTQPFDPNMFIIETPSATVAHPGAVAQILESVFFDVRAL